MRPLGDHTLPKKEAVHEVNPMSITRGAIIDQLVAQVSKHKFAHLNRNKATGHSARGWSGGLQMYSANEKQPNPAGHFRWLNAILAKVAKSPDAQNQIKLANEILEWGGMRTRIKNTDAGHSLLCRVLTSAKRGKHVANAPMNSSYTKIAAVFGYGEGKNTIWDSRVSTAVCFRLACLLVNAKCTPKDATRLFPDLGYVAGMSKRVQRRLELVGRYWPNVYQKWSGHFAGARLLKDPVLRPAELAGGEQGAAHALEQLGVDLADEADGERQGVEPIKAVVHGSHVIHHLVHVLGLVGREDAGLGGEEVVERTLGALDLAGEHGLLTHLHEDEEVGIGKPPRRGPSPGLLECKRTKLSSRGDGFVRRACDTLWSVRVAVPDTPHPHPQPVPGLGLGGLCAGFSP
jgi:hypothetical protein